MNASDAIDLIKGAIPKGNSPAIWADLGSGTGTFTKALAELLPRGSTIIAIDKEDHKISSSNSVTIQFLQADFTKTESLPVNLDGILIANALHYVRDQQNFMIQLKRHLKSSGRILIIEYDTEQSNQWVPYPININGLKQLFLKAGYASVRKIGEKDSIYSQNKIYACVAFLE